MQTLIAELQAKKGLQEIAHAAPSVLALHKNQHTISRNAKEQLISINLAGQGITDQDMERIFKEENLSHLQVLNVSENKLTSLVIPKSVVSLCHIYVSENPNLRQLKFESAQADLELLDARQCALERFELGAGFGKLKKLELRKNKLQSMIFQAGCPMLEHLHLGENQLTSFSLPIGFGSLRYLYLLDNQLEELTFRSRLPNLKTLHLRNNRLKALPGNFLSLEGLRTLYLHNNPLPGIPKEVIASGERDNSRDSIWDYLKSVRDDGKVPLRQAKMILVGNGEVGKTSIRIKLLDRDAPLPKAGKEGRTLGLDVIPYVIENLKPELTQLDDPIDFKMSIWDFGGQGKYREVQQLFCSRKSLYIFVTAHDDSPDKEDYIGFEYWLSMVNAYSLDQEDSKQKHSPVVHVVNKIDEKPLLINQKDRIKIFPNIHPDFIKISCKTLQNFDELESTIRKVLPQISPSIFTDSYSPLWLEVKAQLESKSENHITYKDYEALCLQNQMSVSEAETWIKILGRIGTVIYFGSHPELKEWVILNPAWVKDALYKVLDSGLVRRGILEPSHYEYIWPDNTPEEHQKFVALMLAYMLAYQEEDGHGRVSYVVPALLPAEKPHFPEYLQEISYQVKFDFDPFIPAGTINKLIVSLQQKNSIAEAHLMDRESPEGKDFHTSAYTFLKWKNNVVLHDPKHHAYAHLEEVWEDKTVYLNLYGKNVKPLFDYAKSILEKINQDLIDAKYLEKLVLVPKAWYEAEGEKEWTSFKDLSRFKVDFFKQINSTTTDPNKMTPIKELIRQGRLETALSELEAALPAEHRDEAVQLQSRLNGLKSQNRKGILSTDEFNRERNKISASALELCNVYQEEKEQKAPDKPGTSSQGIRTVKIFLASSAELKSERDALRKFISIENDRLLERAGIYLKLIQWEHFLDAMSPTRLQDTYNQAIQESDVVLSLFFTKAGKFTQEEVEKAWEYFLQHNKPHIFTYFKDAGITTGSAIEDDLMSLWAFKKRLKDLGHFPTSYTNIEDLWNQFKRQLEHLLGL